LCIFNPYRQSEACAQSTINLGKFQAIAD